MQNYPSLPELQDLDESVKGLGTKLKISNVLLMFPDYHMTGEHFQELKKNNFKTVSLLATVADLNHYGYDLSVPESIEEYREKVYPCLIEMHAKIGYWGLQVPVGSFSGDENHDLTEEETARLLKQKAVFDTYGLHVSGVGGNFSPDWKETIKPQIAASNILGAESLYGPYAAIFMGFQDDVASGDDSVAWTKEYLKEFEKTLVEEIGPYAASKGVAVCTEPLQRFESMPIHLKESAELAIKADCDYFKVMIDMCHEYCEGQGPEAYAKLVEDLSKNNKLRGIHVSAIHRGEVYKSWYSQQYFNDFFGPLFANGYDDEICIETFDAVEPVVEAVKVNRERFAHPIGVLINQFVYTVDKLKGFV